MVLCIQHVTWCQWGITLYVPESALPDQLHSISNNGCLDFQVRQTDKRFHSSATISLLLKVDSHTWAGVYLKQYGLQLFIQQNVKPQNLETPQWVFDFHLCHLTMQFQQWNKGDDRLTNDSIYIGPKFWDVVAFRSQLLKNCTQFPLASFVVCITVNVRGAMLVEGVICQVHVNFVHVLWWGGLIMLSTKSSHSFPTDVDPKWVKALQNNINPQIKLELLQQERLHNVLLYHHWPDQACSKVDIKWIVHEEYPFALWASIWLDNEHFWGLIPGNVCQKLSILLRQHPGLWIKTVSIREETLHSLQLPAELNFVGGFWHACWQLNRKNPYSQVQKMHILPTFQRYKCIVRSGSMIISFHLSKRWKAKFFKLCDVIFLVRLQGKFDIDQSWEWHSDIPQKNCITGILNFYSNYGTNCIFVEKITIQNYDLDQLCWMWCDQCTAVYHFVSDKSNNVT